MCIRDSPNIIDLDGKVTPSNQDEQVALVLAVKNKATNVVSDTANIIVTCLLYTSISC